MKIHQLIQPEFRYIYIYKRFANWIHLVDIRCLRKEMEELKELMDDPMRNVRTASSENAVKTRQWLMDSVAQLRDEIDQINHKWNQSTIYQNSQHVQNQIHLVQVSELIVIIRK